MKLQDKWMRWAQIVILSREVSLAAHTFLLFSLEQWFLTRGARPLRGGVNKFPGGREPLHALQHRKILNGNVSLSNVTPVLILRRYMLFGLVSAEMEVGVKYLEILQANIQGPN